MKSTQLTDGSQLPRAWRRKAAAAALACSAVLPAWGQWEPFMGQLALFPYNFCPKNWIEADGQVLPIYQHTALFSLLGTQFGGNGQTTFALPDLRGRVPVGRGQGAGLSNGVLGETGGSEEVTLTTSNLPPHTHGLSASDQAATHAAPSSARALAVTQNAGSYVASAPNTALHASSVGMTGGGAPVGIRNPYLVMRWCIALQGVYPSRN